MKGAKEWAIESMWHGSKGGCLERGREPARGRNQNLMISEKLTDNFKSSLTRSLIHKHLTTPMKLEVHHFIKGFGGFQDCPLLLLFYKQNQRSIMTSLYLQNWSAWGHVKIMSFELLFLNFNPIYLFYVNKYMT